MALSRTTAQWAGVIAVALLLGVGAAAVVRYVPRADGAQVGMRAPDFPIRNLATDRTIGLRSEYAGHVTLINIWATWCHPCEKEMPSMQRLFASYRDRGFRVAAASIDDGAPATVLAFAQAHGLTFDILQDRRGEIQSAYQTIGVPESFLIDRDGKISVVALGAEMWDSPEHRAQVERLLGDGH